MDDFVVWASSHTQLKTMLGHINNYTGDNLCLSLKQSVFGKSDIGLPFLGFLVKKTGIYLLQKSKRRVKERMSEITSSLYQESITEEKAAERVRSVFAAISLAKTNRFRYLLCAKGKWLKALTA